MFATIRYGDEQQLIVATNCMNVILIQFIKEKCGCRAEDDVELSDEQGKVKNLRRHLKDYARKYLNHRENLILLKVHNFSSPNTCGQKVQDRAMYTPLLLSLVFNSDFNAVLNPPQDDETVFDKMSGKSLKTRSLTFERDDDFRKTKSRSKLSCSSRRTTPRRGRKS